MTLTLRNLLSGLGTLIQYLPREVRVPDVVFRLLLLFTIFLHGFTDIDSKALRHWDQMSGLSKIEREEFNIILNPPDGSSGKFIDAWRHLHPEAQEFT